MGTLILTLALGLTPFLHAETKSPALKPKAHDFKKWEKDVAAFEPTLDSFTEVVARAGGDIKVDVIKAKPRAAKQEAH